MKRSIWALVLTAVILMIVLVALCCVSPPPDNSSKRGGERSEERKSTAVGARQAVPDPGLPIAERTPRSRSTASVRAQRSAPLPGYAVTEEPPRSATAAHVQPALRPRTVAAAAIPRATAPRPVKAASRPVLTTAVRVVDERPHRPALVDARPVSNSGHPNADLTPAMEPMDREVAPTVARVEREPAPPAPSVERPVAPVERPVERASAPPRAEVERPSPPPVRPPESMPSSDRLATEERRFVQLINQDREERGIGRLEVAQALVEVAREHSQEMARRNYFDHYSPTAGQRTPMDRVKRKAPRLESQALAVGENIYYCSGVDVARGHRTLMQSPPHREALLSRTYRYVGVGIWKSPSGEFWVTELFSSTRV